MKISPNRKTDNNLNSIVMMIVGGSAVLALILLLSRFRGVVGLLFGGLAALLLIYWLRELRHNINLERIRPLSRSSNWSYDVIEYPEEVSIVAEVPGPAEKVSARLEAGNLQIAGGNDFLRNIVVTDAVSVLRTTYVNGVLNVRLKKPIVQS